MSDQDQIDQVANAGGAYQPPELAIGESASVVAWAGELFADSSPNDTPTSIPMTSAAPEVLRWSVPQPEYDYPDPELFVAPQNPSRRLSGPKTPAKQTHKAGHKTVAHATKTRLTGHDAFGGSLCTCNTVCTCNVVCTCESVATCSCVSHTPTGGGGTTPPPPPPPPSCTCNPNCSCQGYTPCPSV